MIQGIFWRDKGSREIFSDLAIGGYNTENYTVDELQDIIREWYKENEADGDTSTEYWVDDWRENAMLYCVKDEYRDLWSSDPNWDGVVTEREIERLSREWGKSVDDLMEQIEEA